MGWQDGYLGLASFGGVPFRVNTSSVEFGWSTQIKEIQSTDSSGSIASKFQKKMSGDNEDDSPYPLIQKGTKGPRTYTVQARFNDRNEIRGGDRVSISYLDDIDALISIIEQGNPQILQLPLRKPSLCYASRGAIEFSNSSGGEETLSITFIEVEKSPATTVAINNGRLAGSTVTDGESSISSVVSSTFDATASGASSLSEKLSGDLLDVVGFGDAGDSFSDFVTKATALSEDARTIIQTPQRFAEQILDAISDLTYAFTNPIDAFNAQIYIFETYRNNLTFELNGSESRRKQVANNNAIALAVENACVQQIGMSALNIDFDTLNDAILVRKQFESAVRTQQIRNGSASGWEDMYRILGKLLGSVTNYINETANLPSALDYTFGDENPSFVIAHDFYEDADRGDEIVRRNAVRNPLFCDKELELLSR